MKKIKIDIANLTGDALKFAEMFNKAMDEMEVIGKTDIDAAVNALKLTLPKEGVEKQFLMDQIEALKTMISDQGKVMNAFKENPGTKTFQTLKGAIMENLTKHKAAIAKMKGDSSAPAVEFSIELKDAITMTEGASLNNSAYLPVPQMLPGLVDLVRNEPFLLDYLPIMQASSPVITWNNKYNPQGNAAFIGEGDIKPLISFEIKTEISKAKKIADKIKVSNEMLDDISYLMSEINGELRYQVNIKTDIALLSGDGTGDNLKGITEYASAFVLTSLKTTNPNDTDALRAGQAQLKSLNFTANFAFINPIDGANMDMKKATDSGVYLLPPFTTPDGRRVGSMMIVETNQIPQGYTLIMDTRRAKVYKWMEFVIKIGYVNDDFERNLVTIIGEQRLHFFISENHVNGFLYDTFANIKTAIEQEVVMP